MKTNHLDRRLRRLFEFVDKEWRWEGQKSWILWEKRGLEVRIHNRERKG